MSGERIALKLCDRVRSIIPGDVALTVSGNVLLCTAYYDRGTDAGEAEVLFAAECKEKPLRISISSEHAEPEFAIFEDFPHAGSHIGKIALATANLISPSLRGDQ